MGKIKFNNDDKFKGYFNDGRLTKKGELKYNLSIISLNGDLEGGDYNGDFKCGKRHGKGIMKWDDGSLFEGEWSAD